MSLLQTLAVCCICNLYFSYGQFQPVGSRPNVNLKFNLYNNPFGQKDEEDKGETMLKISDMEKPSNAQNSLTNFGKTSGVRRKFGSRRSWALKPTNKDHNPTTNNEKHRERPGAVVNAIANPFLKTTVSVLPTMQVNPSTQNQISIQTSLDNRNPRVQETTQKTDVPTALPVAAEEDEYEIGEASFLVPCQWAGCIGNFQCMRFENNIPIVCTEDSNELCQCMRKKDKSKSTGTSQVLSGPEISKISKPEEEMNKNEVRSLSIPDDMEVGVESIAGVSCQYVGCLDTYQCMTIKHGHPIACGTNLKEQCQCMRKKSPASLQEMASPQDNMLLQLSTEMPVGKTTDSLIPCQFWGCESGYQCLLLANGQKRACPVNSNAICQCIRHVLG